MNGTGSGYHSPVVSTPSTPSATDSTNAVMFFVHYQGWNSRYDEWIRRSRVAKNLTLAESGPSSKSKTASSAAALKREPVSSGYHLQNSTNK